MLLGDTETGDIVIYLNPVDIKGEQQTTRM